MSKKSEILTIEPGSFNGSSHDEHYISAGHVCSYCNGRGYFMPTQIGYNKYIGNPCPVCAATGRLKAEVTIHWVPDTKK
jgi:hypothetical protein